MTDGSVVLALGGLRSFGSIIAVKERLAAPRVDMPSMVLEWIS